MALSSLFEMTTFEIQTWDMPMQNTRETKAGIFRNAHKLVQMVCKTAKTVDARTTDLSLSFTSLWNKQKRERETKIQT